MNGEQKRKEDLEAVKAWLEIAKKNNNTIIQILENLFPGLKESEEERIRKALIRNFTNQHSSNFPTVDGFTREQILSWLKKVIILRHNDIDFSLIEDIKNVIIEAPLLMQSDKEKMISWLEKQGEQKLIEQDTETRDLWVYIREWNEKFGRLPKDEDELASCIDYVMKRQKPADKIEKNPAWSEEDEERIEFLIAMCNDEQAECVNYSTVYRECTETKNWLKSIKDRVQPQQKQEWSEDDETMLTRIINEMESIKFSSSSILEKNIAQEKIDWLKSLKPQNHWKPSEEQLMGMEIAINVLTDNKFHIAANHLKSIYNNLKNL